MSSDLRTIIGKALAPLSRRVRLMAMRGLVKLVDEGKKMQTIQFEGVSDLLRDDVERFQQYGFSSYPKVDAEAVVIMIGGDSDHPICILVDDRRTRPKTLEEGESAMWTSDDGVRVLCKADSEIHIGTDPEEFAARADRVEAELSALRDYVRDHTHPPPTITVVDTFTAAGTGSSSTIAKPASPPPSVGSTACDEVKIK